MQSPGEDKFIPKIIKTTNSEFEALKENLVRPQMVILTILFLKISIRHIVVKNLRVKPTQDLMQLLMKNSR